MSLNIITAMTEERVIGDKKGLPWSIPEELDNFKKITSGSIVIMGKATWESIPEGNRPLKNRFNIVVSSSIEAQKGVVICHTFDEAVLFAKEIAKNTNQEIFFIGGSKIYEDAINYADNLYISWIKDEYSGDIFFPKIDFNAWQKISAKDFESFTFTKYKRRK